MENRYRLLYYVRFMGDSLFFPFFSLYLINLGYQGTTLGFILAMIPMANLIANPLWSFISKDVQKTKKLLPWMALVETLIILLFTQVSSFELLIILTIGVGLLDGPYYLMQDGMTATFCAQNNVDYSTIRIFGSIAYAVTLVFGGLIVSAWGYHTAFSLAAGVFFVAILILRSLAPLQTPAAGKPKEEGNWGELLRQPSFWVYLVFHMLTLTMAGVADGYFAVYLESLGLLESSVGFVLSAAITIEAVTIFLLNRYGRGWNERKWLMIAMTILIVRFAAYSLEWPLVPVLLVSTARGVGWGILIYANLKYIVKIVGVRQVTLAIMLIAIVGSVFAMVMNPLAGYIYERFGFSTLFRFVSLIMLVGTTFHGLFPPQIQPANSTVAKGEI